MDIKAILFESKYCKHKASFIKKEIDVDITVDNYMNYAVPFLFGYTSDSSLPEFLVSGIRTVNNEKQIFCFRNLNFEVDDLIRFDNNIYTITSVNKIMTQGVFEYFITVK